MLEVSWTLHGLLSAVSVVPAAFFASRSLNCIPVPSTSNHTSSRNTRWQGATRWKQGWNAAWKEWDDSTLAEAATPEPIPDERIVNTLHKMPDHMQQTMVVSQKRAQKTYTEQAHQGQNGMLPAQVEARVACEKKCQEAAEAEAIFNGTIKKHSCKTRSARETRQDRDREGGGLGDHGGLLQDAHRTATRSTEAPERARSAAEPAKHSHPFHARKTVQRRKKKQAHAWSTKVCCFFVHMSESEEVWFDVRPNAVGKKRPCPIDELCSESSESSSALDATMARWYEAFEKRVTASQSTHRSEWSSPSETKPRQKGSRRSGGDQTRERGIHCSRCAKCGSVGRRCFACCSRDARDAEDNVVGREARVRIRMTRQNVASTVAGDQGADSPRDRCRRSCHQSTLFP